MPTIHQYSVYPDIPPRLSGLEELAYNLRWTWDARAYKVFQHLDPEMLEKCKGNPVLLLRRVSRERLEQAVADSAFLTHLDEAVEDLRRYLSTPGWFRVRYPDRAGVRAAYFCMEYGLTACLPIYSGGLGVLAGDHLKSASGLDLPLVAVGLLYSRGYFSQSLDGEGWQYEDYRVHDFSTLPVRPVMVGETWRPAAAATPDAAGGDTPSEQLKVEVGIDGRTIGARVWKAQVGRVSLYLLDSNIPENDASGQRVTGELYGGGVQERLAQELLLGVGGMRTLRALGVDPTVCHLNEGHAVFTSLERIRTLMHEHGLSMLEARQATGAGTLFTTHTPVPAGFDLFPEPLIESYLSAYLQELGLDAKEFMDMGRTRPGVAEEDFNVAILALRHSPRRNAVSRLHRRTTARMMEPGWAGFPLREMPVESVTNGVHTKSWVSSEMALLYDHYLGPRWREDSSEPKAWQRVDQIPDVELWNTHARLRERLVAYARGRALAQARDRRASLCVGPSSTPPLRPDALTIGFARRFATYKRATLLFRDVARLRALLTDEDRPVQLIMAGKAHPKDGAGKDFIREIVETVRRENLEDRVIFMEDHDLSKAALLVQGADVWLNTPRRPYEACGTSGMKVVPNGGLNLSVLDGWWAEAYRPGVGWAIGDGQEFAHWEYQDEVDSESLYSLLEHEIVPMFYDRDADGLPRDWIAMMKASIKILAPAFSGDRMLKQYTERFYLPASDRYALMTADDFAKAREVTAWKCRMREGWDDVKVTWVEQQGASRVTVAAGVPVTAKVRLGGLEPGDVRVEAYAGSLRADGALHNGKGYTLDWVRCEDGEHLYQGSVPSKSCGLHGYAVRVLPTHPDVLVPNELRLIAWEEGEE